MFSTKFDDLGVIIMEKRCKRINVGQSKVLKYRLFRFWGATRYSHQCCTIRYSGYMHCCRLASVCVGLQCKTKNAVWLKFLKVLTLNYYLRSFVTTGVATHFTCSRLGSFLKVKITIENDSWNMTRYVFLAHKCNANHHKAYWTWYHFVIKTNNYK